MQYEGIESEEKEVGVVLCLWGLGLGPDLGFVFGIDSWERWGASIPLPPLFTSFLIPFSSPSFSPSAFAFAAVFVVVCLV